MTIEFSETAWTMADVSTLVGLLERCDQLVLARSSPDQEGKRDRLLFEVAKVLAEKSDAAMRSSSASSVFA